MNDITSNVIAQIENAIDNRNFNFSIVDFLEHYIVVNYKKSNDAIEKEIAIKIKEFYKPQKDELYEALHLTQSKAKTENQKQLVEGYSLYKKKQLRDLFDFLQKILDECDSIINKIKIRKTKIAKRKIKTQDISKILKNFKYMKENSDLNIRSIDPETLFKYNVIIAYDVKYNKFLLYETNNQSNFVISGTTLTNANCIKKAGSRNPKIIIDKLMSANSSNVKSIFSNLKGNETSSSNRMNSNIIILKGFKV